LAAVAGQGAAGWDVSGIGAGASAAGLAAGTALAALAEEWETISRAPLALDGALLVVLVEAGRLGDRKGGNSSIDSSIGVAAGSLGGGREDADD